MSDPHLNTLALGMDLTGRTVRNFQGKGFLQSVSPQDFHDLSWLCRNDTPRAGSQSSIYLKAA